MSLVTDVLLSDLIRMLLRVFVILGLALPAFAQYSTPSILSRGEAPAGTSIASDGLTYSLSLLSEYTNAATGILTLSNQGTTNPSAFGAAINLNVSAGHSWEYSHLDFSYNGSFQDYSQASSYSGLSQSLSFEFTHQVSPHVALTVRDSGSLLLRSAAFAFSDASTPTDTFLSALPITQFFDNRTLYNTTQANLTVQRSAELSFDLGGGYFITQQQSTALYGAKGETATVDMQYRLSPHATIGANYTFFHYFYTRGIGDAYVHSAAFTAAYRLSRSTEFSFFVGPSRLASSFEATVPIDPTNLQALCPPAYHAGCPFSEGLLISNSTSWAPNFGGRFSHALQRGVAYVSAMESITPGNGLFLTSKTTTASAGYDYSGFRYWSLGISASYMSALSLGNVTGHYGDFSGSYHASRQITGALSFVSTFTAMRYQSQSIAAYNRLIYTASAGFSLSSSKSPSRIF